MSDKPETVVLPDSPDAAQLKTVTGWVSRHGLFYGKDEIQARYDGCTHVKCSECGVVVEKGYTACEECREKFRIVREADRKREEWDQETPLYSEAYSEYLMDFDEVEDYLDQHECTFEHLDAVLCEKNEARIELDHFGHLLGDDYDDAPKELTDAIDAFNKAMSGIAISWSATDVVATCKELQPEDLRVRGMPRAK